MKTAVVLLFALLAPAGTALAQTPVHSPPHNARSHSHTDARAHPATPAFDAIGTYDLDLDMHGQVTGAVLSITQEKDMKLKGTLAVHGQSIELETVTVDDHVVTLASGSELRFTLTFKNDNEFTGKWVRADESGTLSGIRRKA